MGSHTQLTYHVVFSTKYRRPVMSANIRERVYEYMGGTIRGRKGHLLEVGGVEDHIHLLMNIPPTESVSNFIRDVMSGTSKWINDSNLVSQDFRWQKGYGAFTVSFSQIESVRDYIQNQEIHHRKLTFKQEYVLMLKRHNIQFEDRFLFEREHHG